MALQVDCPICLDPIQDGAGPVLTDNCGPLQKLGDEKSHSYHMKCLADMVNHNAKNPEPKFTCAVSRLPLPSWIIGALLKRADHQIIIPATPRAADLEENFKDIQETLQAYRNAQQDSTISLIIIMLLLVALVLSTTVKAH